MRARRGARLGLIFAGFLLLGLSLAAGQKALPGALEQSKADVEAAKCAFATAKGLTEILGPLSGCKSPPPPAPGSSPSPPPPAATPAASPPPPPGVTPPAAQPPAPVPAPVPAPAPATKLVLAVGGLNRLPFRALSSAELYDVASGTWSFTGNMTSPRRALSVTKLPDGKVLAAAGRGLVNLLASAELYDPVSRQWTRTPTDLAFARNFAQLVTLADGRALIAGGFDDAGIQATSELYGPNTGSWSLVSSMSVPRAQFGMVTTVGGSVLAAGGLSQPTSATNTVDVFSPATLVWQPTGAMLTARANHQVVALLDGRVLAVGGVNATGQAVATAEVWDPNTGTWTATLNEMSAPRYDFQAKLLASGLVLAAAGRGDTSGGSDLFDPATNTWTPAGRLNPANAFTFNRADYQLTALSDGRALAAGGFAQDPALAELYDPQSRQWSNTGSLGEGREFFGMVLLD